MSFTNNLKKSLGFDEEYSDLTPVNRGNTYDDYNVPNYGLNISSEFDDDYLDDFTISPEQPFYEIVLIKPKSMDDMDYVFDQIVQEGNPVVLDLIFLQKKGINEYRQAAERLKILRDQYNAQAILLSQSTDKNLILLTPSRVKISKKD
ncbi:MAG: cell division protein SepF [Methanobacteriaceae archaeon]|nr:cell division protein SepF [Methanobacteriaceae archaeon]